MRKVAALATLSRRAYTPQMKEGLPSGTVLRYQKSMRSRTRSVRCASGMFNLVLMPVNSLVFQQIDVEHDNSDLSSKAVIRMFGVTEAGHSVLAYVKHFKPYFYIPAPAGFTREDCQPFQHFLSKEFFVESVELVHKKPLLGYRGDSAPLFIKISVPDPKLIPKARDKWPSFLP